MTTQRVRRGLVAVAALLLGAAPIGTNVMGPTPASAASKSAAKASPVATLTSVDQLAKQFDADQGVARLVLLISPT